MDDEYSDDEEDYYLSLAIEENNMRRKKILDEKIMPRLHQEAENRTWDFLQNLVKQRKAPDFADSALENANKLRTKYPNFSFRTHLKEAMYYYFADDLDSPYCLLRVNRDKENGDRIARVSMAEATNLNSTVQRDQQFLKLREEFEKCDLIEIENGFDPDVNLVLARKFAIWQNLLALNRMDLIDVLDEVSYVKIMSKRFDDAHEFCYRLLEDDVKDALAANKEEFIREMNQKYKFSNALFGISHLIRLVDEISQKNKRSKTNESMHRRVEVEMIDAYFNDKWKDNFEPSSFDRSVYTKLKLKLAEEIGLITKNENTGLYEETIHADFLSKPVEELEIEYAV